jgi:hypothetical protein
MEHILNLNSCQQNSSFGLCFPYRRAVITNEFFENSKDNLEDYPYSQEYHGAVIAL